MQNQSLMRIKNCQWNNTRFKSYQHTLIVKHFFKMCCVFAFTFTFSLVFLLVFGFVSQRKWWTCFLPLTHTHTQTHKHTHTHWGRGGESRAQAKEGLRQQRASEENGDHAGRVPPLVDAAQRADFLLALPPAVLSTLLHFTLRWGELGSACCFHRVGRRAVSGAGSPSPGGGGGGGGGGGALLAGGDKLSRRCCLVSRDWAMLVSG